ncbi:MAG: hypothetical protein LIO85_09710 [Rikenellaceae bacterium]|nr:hypothetical protein [Rikenellaceae bacterium]
MSDIYHGNLFSKPVREGLIISWTIIRLYDGEEKITKRLLAAHTGLPASSVTYTVSKLIMHGWLVADTKVLTPVSDFTGITLYDIITVFDGWLHIGNANLDSLHNVTQPGCGMIWSCENLVRELLEERLATITVNEFTGTSDTKRPVTGKPTRLPETVTPATAYEQKVRITDKIFSNQ